MARYRNSCTDRIAFLILTLAVIIPIMTSELVVKPMEETTTVEVTKKITSEVIETEETTTANYVAEPTDNQPLFTEPSTWYLTAYCSCPTCVGYKEWPIDEDGEKVVFGAEGTRLYGGFSCAADYSIPFGTQLEVTFADGSMRVLTVQDRFGSDTYHRIDLYCDSHEEALLYGYQAVTVRVLT